jgi:excisionase family DNA binding protein
MPKKFYSVKEASIILGVSTNTIYKYLDVGSLKGKRFNDRGRFKIPYSEIAPYLAREVPDETTEKTQVDKKGGAKFAFFDSLGISMVVLVVIYILWSLGRSAAVSQPSLITDVGSAILGYSDRTFSGFGSFVSRVLPGSSGNQEVAATVQKSVSETQPGMQNDIVSNPVKGFDTGEKAPDLSYKISDTEGRTNDLYANVQVLSSNARTLLGKSKTLTSAELNGEIDKMSQLLGSLSDSSDKGTIFAEINWLGENWDFSNIEAGRRAASQVSYLLASLRSQSLAAFTKPDIQELDNLVIETDSLLGAIGNPSDTSAEKTLFGNIKGVKVLAQALDAKGGEIDKILGSWDSYSTSEKEDTVRIILSESLSINRLLNIEETIFSKLSIKGTDAELKNSLLSVKGVLEANKIHLAQKAGEPLLVTWLDSGGDVKILAVNPSALTSQKTTIKYYLPEGIGKGQVGRIDGGLNLSFDTQKKQYYVEGNPILAAGEIRTISIKVNNDTSLAKVATPVEPTNAPMKQTVSLPEAGQVAGGAVEKTGQVAGEKTSNYPPQNIVIWGSVAAIFISGLVLWVIYLKSKLGRRNKESLAMAVLGEASILLPEDKLNTDSVVPAPSPSHVSFSLPRMEFHAIKKAMASIIAFFSKILASIKKFFVDIASAIGKIPVVIKTGLVTILVSISTFFLKLLTSIKKFFISLVTGFARLIASFIASLKRGFLAVIRAIKTFFLSLISAVRKVIVSIKTGILAILSSITAFFLRLLTSIKKFFISLVTGFARLIASFIASLKRGFLAVIRAIKTFFVNIASAIAAFIASIVSAIVKARISVKKTILAVLASIKAFFLKVVSSIVNFITAILISIRNGFRAIIHTIKTFFVNIASAVKAFFASIVFAITKAIISIKKAILDILASIMTFFRKVILSTANFITAVVVSIKKGISATINAVITFLANIISAVTKVITSVIMALQKAAISITTLFLKILSKVVRSVASIIRRLLRILSSIAKFADLTLTRLDFKTPTIRKSRANFRNAATFLLIGLTSAAISGVLAFKFMSLIGEDVPKVQGQEVVNSNENIVLIEVPKEISGVSAGTQRCSPGEQNWQSVPGRDI